MFVVVCRRFPDWEKYPSLYTEWHSPESER